MSDDLITLLDGAVRAGTLIPDDIIAASDAIDDGATAGPVLVRMADVEARSIRWLWPGRIPLGRLSLLVGRPGEGKSYLTCDMAARVSTGTPWPDGGDCPRGSVLMVSAEDDPGDTIRPRLDAHHADCRRVHLLSAVRRVDEVGQVREALLTLADVASIETAMRRLRDCRLVVIDPIGSFLEGATDAHRDNEVRGVLAPIARLAERYDAAVLIVAHRRKSAGANADESALGSRAFTGIARAVWHLSRDADDRRRRLLLPGKNNLAMEGDGLAFAIGGDPPALRWERDPVTITADDALAAEQSGPGRPGPEPEARNAAADWLRDLLASGEAAAAKIKAEAADAGLNYRTVQRAADSLGVVREKNRFSGGWQWRLPRPSPSEKEGDKLYGVEGDKSPRGGQPVHLSPSRFQPGNADSGATRREGDKLGDPVALGSYDAPGGDRYGLPDAPWAGG